MMVPHVVSELRSRGADEKSIEKLVWDNPWNFFSKSGRLK
jgi:predicted metal-dependent phosphotriesterase family hydrolase